MIGACLTEASIEISTWILSWTLPSDRSLKSREQWSPVDRLSRGNLHREQDWRKIRNSSREDQTRQNLGLHLHNLSCTDVVVGLVVVVPALHSSMRLQQAVWVSPAVCPTLEILVVDADGKRDKITNRISQSGNCVCVYKNKTWLNNRTVGLLAYIR